MDFFPIFLRLEGARVVVAGGGAAAVAKLRLILKTTARIEVYAGEVDPVIADWAREGRLFFVPQMLDRIMARNGRVSDFLEIS